MQLRGSCRAYSARLCAEWRSRSLVLASGAGLGVAGLAIAATLPIHVALAGSVTFVWAAGTAAAWRRTLAAYRSVLAITLWPDGGVQVETTDGGRATGRLAAGSLVLGTCAWVRLELDGGRCWGELLFCRRQDRDQWRRFQVICRHFSA